MKLQIRPLTPDLWPALTDLFGENGACNGCWCMYWRIGNAYRKKPRSENKAAFRKVVKLGPPPGLMAFYDDLPVGWCQLTPRYSPHGFRNDGPALVCNAALGHAVRVNPIPLERQIQALCDAIIACQDKERAIILAEQLQVVLLERIDQMQG
jgi:hypothetical protein